MPPNECIQVRESFPPEPAEWGLQGCSLLANKLPEAVMPAVTTCNQQPGMSSQRGHELSEQLAMTSAQQLPQQLQHITVQSKQHHSTLSAPHAAARVATPTCGPTLKGHKAPRLRWTSDLHELFMRCVDQLGGIERATPKHILKSMQQQRRGLQALTILHVKSHLQKLRTCSRQDGEEQPRTLTLQALGSKWHSSSNSNPYADHIWAPRSAPLPRLVPASMLDSGGSDCYVFSSGCSASGSEAGDPYSPSPCAYGPGTPALGSPDFRPRAHLSLSLNLLPGRRGQSLLSSSNIRGVPSGGLPSPTEPAPSTPGPPWGAAAAASWVQNAHAHHPYLSSGQVSERTIHLSLMGHAQGGRVWSPATPGPIGGTHACHPCPQDCCPCPEDCSEPLVDEWDMPARGSAASAGTQACHVAGPSRLPGQTPGQTPGQHASLVHPGPGLVPGHQGLAAGQAVWQGLPGSWGSPLQGQAPGAASPGMVGGRSGHGVCKTSSMPQLCIRPCPAPAPAPGPAHAPAHAPGLGFGHAPAPAPGLAPLLSFGHTPGLPHATALDPGFATSHSPCPTLGGLSGGPGFMGGPYRKPQLSRVASCSQLRDAAAATDLRLEHAIMQHELLQNQLQQRQKQLLEATKISQAMAPVQGATAQRQESLDPVLSSFLDFTSDDRDDSMGLDWW